MVFFRVELVMLWDFLVLKVVGEGKLVAFVLVNELKNLLGCCLFRFSYAFIFWS